MTFLLFLLLFSSSLCQAFEVSGRPPVKAINVGFLLEDAESQPERSMALERIGTEIGMREANRMYAAKHGIIFNLLTKEIPFDGVKEAASAVLDFHEKKVSVFFGGLGRHSSAVVAAAATFWKKPFVTPNENLIADILLSGTKFSYASTLSGPTSFILALRDFLQKIKIDQIQVVGSHDMLPVDQLLRTHLAESNISVAATTSFALGASSKTKRDVAETVRANGFRYIVILSSHKDTHDMLIELDAVLGSNPDYSLFAFDVLFDEASFELADTPERNAAARRSFERSYSVSRGVSESSETKIFFESLRSNCLKSTSPCAFPVNGTINTIQIQKATRLYSGILTLAHYIDKAMAQLQENPGDGDEMSLVLDSMRASTYIGMVGGIKFSPEGEGLTAMRIEVMRNQEQVTVASWNPFSGTEFQVDAFKKYVRPGPVWKPREREWWDDGSHRATVLIPLGVFLVAFAALASLWFYNTHQLSTEKKRLLILAEAAKRERDLAEESNANKRKFLRYMMHELRVPFHVLDVGLQSLAEEGDLVPPHVHTLVDQMLEASSMMSGLMNDALDLHKIEEGRFDITKKAFDPTKMLQFVIDAHTIRTKERSQTMFLTLDPSCRPCLVISDEIRLRQCLSNLLDNAIKFSPIGGRIDVSCSIDKGNTLLLSVKDEGPGVSALNRPKLFETWSQINAGELQKGQGSGLGLSLVKTMMGVLNGKASVESVEGHGACFTLSIPVETTPKLLSQISSKTLEISPSTLSGIRILVVDDTEDVRFAIARMLTQKGAIVSTKSGTEAASLLHSEFELVLIDNDLDTGTDSSIVCKKFAPLMPVFAVVREMRSEDVVELKSRGALEVLQKPIRIESLLAAIKQHNICRIPAAELKPCTNGNGNGHGGPVSTRSASTRMPHSLLPLSGLRILIVDDVQVVRAVMQRLLSQKGAIVSTAKNGLESLERVKSDALEGRPFDLVLMDKEMDVMDGYEASDKMPPGTIIFGLTGNAMEEDIAEFKSHGVVEVLSKPLKFDSLLSVIEAHHIVPHPFSGSFFGSESVEMKSVGVQMPISAVEGMKVLVVDDVNVVRSVMTRLLTQKGAVVICASNGLEAIEIVSREMRTGKPFDLVLMDKEMPIMNGPEACDKLCPNTTVIGVTANALPEDIAEFKSHGAVAVLTKPLKFESLLHAMEEHQILPRLEEPRLFSSRHNASTQMRSVSTQMPKSIVDGMRILIVDDVELVRTVMSRLLVQKGAITTLAENGLEAVELVRLRTVAREPFDLVLMDSEMPVMSGPEACKQIPPDTPVIGITSFAFEEDINRFKEHGAIAVLTKPLKFESLAAAMEKHLGENSPNLATEPSTAS